LDQGAAIVSKRAPFVMPIYTERLLGSKNWGGRPGPERTAFLALLVVEWAWDGLPDDEDLLAHALGYTPEHFHDIWIALRSQWDRYPEGKLRNQQLESFRQEALSHKKALSDAGKAGNASRWRSPSDRLAIAMGSPPSPSPSPSPEEERTPPPPSGVTPSRAKPPRARKGKPLWKGHLPAALEQGRFPEAWSKWLRFRAEELRKPVTQLSGEQALLELAGWGHLRAAVAIEHTIAKGWQGIREPEPDRRNGQHEQSSRDAAEDRLFEKEFGISSRKTP
jgi:hypothetical protein